MQLTLGQQYATKKEKLKHDETIAKFFEVHYLASKTKKAVGGIAEFMETDFLKNFHPNVWNAMKKQHKSIQDLDWTTVSQLPTIFTPIPCLQ